MASQESRRKGKSSQEEAVSKRAAQASLRSNAEGQVAFV